MKTILQKSVLGITLLFTAISQADSLPKAVRRMNVRWIRFSNPP